MPRMSAEACAKIHDAVYRKILGLGLARGAKILDAPCGQGELATLLSKAGCEVWGADIVSSLSAEAAAGFGKRFYLADLNGPLPWPDASFDLVVCVEGVEHLENPFAFFREARRICRPGGCFIISTPNTVSLRSRVRYFGSSFYTQDPRPLNESTKNPAHHIGLRTFWEWRYLLHTTGFRLVDVLPTHIKPASYLYGLFAPWTWVYTRIAFRKEKDPWQKARNAEIRRALGSPALLFGENILLVSRTEQG
jgi:SAM-dependent methyltransferase